MGSASKDTHAHLMRFLQLCVFVRLLDIDEEQTKFIFFAFSLGRNATAWLNSLPNHSSTTWDEVKEKFLNHFFPESRVEAIREKIINFR